MNEALITRLGALDLSLQDNKVNTNDRVLALISACITEGVDQGPSIVEVLARLGFDRRHVGLTLNKGIQQVPVWPNWGRRDDGRYYVPDPT
ncbi:hypothetical protein G6N82_05945 [Altererythrobacter sp. BO-6]|uniref:hypothetical protein n=1 Tax=Altererythrobacter sp. BO-6 TaxID=2604537 RepID=UPI0013E18A52|nr:hypothetical protein [Altererythrobacter sp. BO-6]QIG53755.1 hypothetical protein G6N82_05945 [Altererythrobacter sp. BO-6]